MSSEVQHKFVIQGKRARKDKLLRTGTVMQYIKTLRSQVPRLVLEMEKDLYHIT